MITDYSDAQLAQGEEAWRYMAFYQATHETMPPNFRDFLSLPLAITDPITEEKRAVLIGYLTPKDILDWAANDEIETQIRHLTENREGK